MPPKNMISVTRNNHIPKVENMPSAGLRLRVEVRCSSAWEMMRMHAGAWTSSTLLPARRRTRLQSRSAARGNSPWAEENWSPIRGP